MGLGSGFQLVLQMNSVHHFHKHMTTHGNVLLEYLQVLVVQDATLSGQLHHPLTKWITQASLKPLQQAGGGEGAGITDGQIN